MILFRLPLIWALAVLLLTACAPSAAQRWADEVQRSYARGFRPLDLYAPPFHLSGLLKGQKNSDLVVYLEGDGRAIIHGQPSSDPTPREAQSLQLALLDPDPCVLYLARVGQFQPNYANRDNEAYWSDKRLSEEVVAAASSAIEQVKIMVGAARLHLIGYSGGGGLAVLVAERRLDVASIVTVAGLLDTDWWVQNRGWRPLDGSLNPIKEAWATSFVPQLHIFGQKDQIIPSEMSARFLRAAKFTKIDRLAQNNDHYSGWTKAWPDLLAKYVMPLRKEASQPLKQAAGSPL